jgi:NAD(P)-dependent dehydrogenase (short-subunit alcohol dehydrogenase family)
VAGLRLNGQAIRLASTSRRGRSSAFRARAAHSFALRNELKDTDMTVTCLMPGATETEFFNRAGLQDTPLVGQASKDDRADVAEAGFKAIMNGEGDVVTGWQNKLESAIANGTPSTRQEQLSDSRPVGAVSCRRHSWRHANEAACRNDTRPVFG